MLDICYSYCEEWDIGLNSKKTKNLYFGKAADNLFNVTMNGAQIHWEKEWSYLGVMLQSGKSFGCSVNARIKKFYRCANAILRIDGHSDELVMLRLVEVHCVPLLTYATEIIHVANRDEKRQMRVAYNSLFRKIFAYRWSQSVTALQHFLGRPTWEELVDKRRNTFIEDLRQRDTVSLSRAFAV